MSEPASSLRIRRALPDDAGELQNLLVELGYPRAPIETLTMALEAVLSRPERTVLLVEDSDLPGLIGMASLTASVQLRLAALVVVIDELVVRASARGRGVGSLLLREVRKVATSLGAVRIELHTNRARESYRRGFYGSHGFEEIESAVMRIELPHQPPA